VNIFFIDGNLTDDPKGFENRCTFSIAHNYTVKEEKKVVYYNCVCFNEILIKNIIRDLKKGDKVFVKGMLRDNDYEGKKYWNIIVDYYAIRYKKNKEDLPF